MPFISMENESDKGEQAMVKVGIVMGSDSDMPVMAKAAEMLDKFGIEYEMTIISAHREPDIFFAWAKAAEAGKRLICRGCARRFFPCR